YVLFTPVFSLSLIFLRNIVFILFVWFNVISISLLLKVFIFITSYLFFHFVKRICSFFTFLRYFQLIIFCIYFSFKRYTFFITIIRKFKCIIFRIFYFSSR